MVKYCHKCGARYTEYLEEGNIKCPDCRAKERREWKGLSAKQIYQIWMNHAH